MARGGRHRGARSGIDHLFGRHGKRVPTGHPPHLSEFAARVLREATGGGFTEAARPVVWGDGSVSIGNTAAELFPQATQILHRSPAQEHLSHVAPAVDGDSWQGKPWRDRRYDQLEEGRWKSLVEALHVHADQYQEARDGTHYLGKNRRRLRYPGFHQQGFCTSTGVLEAGCKVAIGTRLKRAGRHGTVQGANAIIALRCNKLSGRLEDFWERRSDQRKAAA